jgi:hypothetical protein
MRHIVLKKMQEKERGIAFKDLGYSSAVCKTGSAESLSFI